jgi:hypothetical protein
LEQQCAWQWEKVDGSYHPSKIQFSENSGPAKSVSSAEGAVKLYFDDSIMDIIAIETNEYASFWCKDCRADLCFEGCFKIYHTKANF